MIDFLVHLFDTSGFPARWTCGLWSPGHGWLHVLSDLGIWSAYFTIPVVLAFFVWRRRDLPFRKVFVLFGAFILLCGATHLMDAALFWWPAYRLAGVIKLLTAVVSWVTVLALVRVAPTVLAMRSPDELEREIAARELAEDGLRRANADLDRRVEERTEQLMRSNASLQESEERLRLAVEVAGLGVMRIDYPAGTADLSPLAAELFDLPAGVPVARGAVHGRFHPDDSTELESRIARCLDPTGDGWFAFEHRVVRADGSIRWLSVRKRVFFDASGPSRAVLVAADITDRKLAEEQLAATNGRLNALLDALPVGVSFSEDASCEHITGNPAVLAQFAVRSTDNLSASAADPAAAGRQVQFYQAGRAISDSELPLQRAVAENRVIPTMELEVVLPDGRQWFAEASGAPIHDERGIVIAGVAVTVDVTDRKLAETRLRESEERLRLALKAAGAIAFVWDIKSDAVIRYFSTESALPVTAERLGTLAEVRARVHPDDLHVFDSRLSKCLAAGNEYRNEYRVVRPDGTTTCLEEYGYFDLAADGSPLRLNGVSIDITARRRTEGRFRRLVESNAQGVIFWNTDGRITGANDAFLGIVGYSREDLEAGRVAWATMTPPEYAHLDRRSLVELAARGVCTPFEKEYVRKDGSRVPVLLGAATFEDRPEEGVCFVIDITERKRAEEAIRATEAELYAADRRLAELVLGMSEACFVLDSEWRFTFANNICESLLHHRPKDMLGKSIWVLFSTLLGTTMEGHYRRAMSQKTPVAFVAFSPIAKRWLDIRLFPTGSGLAAFLLDIHDRTVAEQQVRTLNAELEERVAQRTTQLAEANRELEAFSYSVSHDLRAPLRAVDGFARILLEDFAAHLPAEAQDCLREVCVNAKQMGQLIDDLLAFSRLTRQSLHTVDVSVDTLVRQCVSDLSRGSPAEFRIAPELPSCSADPTLLKQVWVNLIENAVKYSRFREPPVIEIGATTGDVETVYFVKDNGVGFDMRYAHKLFGVFQRLHRQEDFEGTGVGLAIVQRVIHRHGGRVWAEAQLDRGATFFFSLPIRRAVT